jgi:hypothetical protein
MGMSVIFGVQSSSGRFQVVIRGNGGRADRIDDHHETGLPRLVEHTLLDRECNIGRHEIGRHGMADTEGI